MEDVKKSLKQDITDEEATKLIKAFVSDPVAFMDIHSNPSITALFTNKTVIAKLEMATLKKIINTPYITTTLSKDNHTKEYITSFNTRQTRAKEYYKLAAEFIIKNTQLLNRLPSEFIKDICIRDQNYATEIMKIAGTITWSNDDYISDIATQWPMLRQAAANTRQGVSVDTAKVWLFDDKNQVEAHVALLINFALDPAISVDFWMPPFNKIRNFLEKQQSIVKQFLGPEVDPALSKQFIVKFYNLGFFNQDTALMQLCLLKPEYAAKVVSLYRKNHDLQKLITKGDIAKLQFFSWINDEHTRNNTSVDQRTVGNIIAKLLYGFEASLIEYDDLSSASTMGENQGPTSQTTTGHREEKTRAFTSQEIDTRSDIKKIFSESGQLDEAAAHRLIIYIFNQRLKKPTFADDFCREVDKLVAFRPICNRIKAIQKFWNDVYKPADVSKLKDPVATIISHYNNAHSDETQLLLPPPTLNPELGLVPDAKKGGNSSLGASQPSSSPSSGSPYSSSSSSFSHETKGGHNEPREGVVSLPSPSAPILNLMENKQSVIDGMILALGGKSPPPITDEILDSKKSKLYTFGSDSSSFFVHPRGMKELERGDEPEPGSKPKPDVEIAKEFLGYDREKNKLGWVQSKDVSSPVYDAEGNFHGFTRLDGISKEPVLGQLKNPGNEGEVIEVEEDFDNASLEQGEPSDVVPDSDERLKDITWGR